MQEYQADGMPVADAVALYGSAVTLNWLDEVGGWAVRRTGRVAGLRQAGRALELRDETSATTYIVALATVREVAVR